MSELAEFRKAKDEFLAKDPHSPLTPQQRQRFHGLGYYPENSELRLTLKIHEFPDQDKQVAELATNTGGYQCQVRWGRFRFDIDGEGVRLTLYRDVEGDEYFLPFTDSMTGGETYGGGRYLDVVSLGAGYFLLDFNYAYNPYCAYNPRWSCPIPPPENSLKVPIQAGEKKFN